MTLSVAAIISEFGSFYKNSGQSIRSLIKKIYQPSVTLAKFTKVMTDNTIYELSEAETDEVLQPFQTDFTDKGTIKFKPIAIPLYHVKIDRGFVPQQLSGTWLDFLDSNKLKPVDMPFTQWYITEHLLPKYYEDLEKLAVFHGLGGTPTPGVAGSAVQAIIGFRKQLIDGMKAGRVQKIELSDLTSSNIHEQVESFYDQVPELYRTNLDSIFSSEKWGLFFQRDKRNQFGYVQNDLSGKVDFTSLMIEGLPSMRNSNILFATPKTNRLFIGKNLNNEGVFDMQPFDRKVKLLGDWWIGLGFPIPELVFAYVPDSELGATTCTTKEADEIATTSVMLNGKVNPKSVATTVTWQYALNPWMDDATDLAHGGAALDDADIVTIEKELTGLTSKTTYYFRIKAVGAETVYGNVKTFTTL